MATDEGLAKISHARKHIELLRARREFLVQRIEYRSVTHTDAVNGFDEAEIRALDFALPVLEAEWDNLARLRRNVERVENRLINLERRGVETDRRDWPHAWEQAEANG